MSRTQGSIRIHYLRPPDRRETFVQRLILDDPDVKITLAEKVHFDPPIRIQGETVLEPGSDVVWFTFPDLWHDIGRFHLSDGRFSGIYANILTPATIHPEGTWETTDLFLDVWVDPRGQLSVLDADQLLEAEEEGWVSRAQADRAREEVTWIRREFERGRWPPRVVSAWTLNNVRRSVGISHTPQLGEAGDEGQDHDDG